jgi:uncharacterized protein YegP (UPF0339 family)
MATQARDTERIEFFRGADEQWYFHWVGANNEIVAEGEGYRDHADAVAAVDAIFRPVPWWERAVDGTWRQTRMSENEDGGGLEPQTVTEGEEVPEPAEFEDEPEEEGVEDGPDPEADWDEDEPGDDE